MTIDQQYNAARTEFKSSMKMNTKDGDIHHEHHRAARSAPASVQQANRERDEKIGAMKKQAEVAMARAPRRRSSMPTRRSSNAPRRSTTCNGTASASTASATRRPTRTASQEHGRLGPDEPGDRQELQRPRGRVLQALPDAGRLPQGEGRRERGADVRRHHRLDQGGAVPESGAERLARLPRRYCPVEAKPIAQEHCTGRDYTSKMGGKYARFCEAYLAHASLEKPPAPPT